VSKDIQKEDKYTFAKAKNTEAHGFSKISGISPY
jgi:hypothetical protein